MHSMANFFRKKRCKFEVTVQLKEFQDVPFVNGTIFAKIRLLQGRKLVGESRHCQIRNNTVLWNEEFKFKCEIPSNPASGYLEPCSFRVSVRKETKGGKSHQKLGFADVNVSELTKNGIIGKHLSTILEGYSNAKEAGRDNSRLLMHVSVVLQSMDASFRPPPTCGDAGGSLDNRIGVSSPSEDLDRTLMRAPSVDGGSSTPAGSTPAEDEGDPSSIPQIHSPEAEPTVVHPRVIHAQEYAKHYQRASDPELHVQSPPSLSSESSSGCGSLRASGSDSGGRPGHSRNASSASQQSASHLTAIAHPGTAYQPPSASSHPAFTHSRHSSAESGQSGHHHHFMGHHRKSSDSAAMIGLHVPAPNSKMSTSCGSSDVLGSLGGGPRKRYAAQDTLGHRLDRTRLDPHDVVEDVVLGLDGLVDDHEGLRLDHLQ